MKTVTSKDGTLIAYEKVGKGPALILVDGALCYTKFGPMPDLAPLLADHFTVYYYDRRGRGDSGNVLPYATDREIEDLEAVLEAAGGEAYLFGASSGGIIALETANTVEGIKKVAVYEAPMIIDDTHAPMPEDYITNTQLHIINGRPGEAVKMFMKMVGMPRFAMFIMGFTPAWKKLVAVGHTLPHDLAFVEPFQQGKPLPKNLWKHVTMPTLVLDGGKSPEYMRNGQHMLSQTLPHASYRTMKGQTHNIPPAILAPALIEFLS